MNVSRRACSIGMSKMAATYLNRSRVKFGDRILSVTSKISLTMARISMRILRLSFGLAEGPLASITGKGRLNFLGRLIQTSSMDC